MAFLIKLYRLEKDSTELFSVYSYEYTISTGAKQDERGRLRATVEVVKGRVKIDLKTGDVEVLDFADSDKGGYAHRACLALYKAWQKNELSGEIVWCA